VVCDGGAYDDVRRLPYRVRSEASEGARLCVVLNALRELLYPHTAEMPRRRLADDAAAALLQTRPITKAAYAAHLALAEAHGTNSKLIDPDGDAFPLLEPLSGVPPRGLKFSLGAGLTLYLELISTLAAGFFGAALISAPVVAFYMGAQRDSHPHCTLLLRSRAQPAERET
jgi:hypothetical protein